MYFPLLGALALSAAPTTCPSLPDMSTVAADLALPPLSPLPAGAGALVAPGTRSVVKLGGAWGVRDAYVVIYVPPLTPQQQQRGTRQMSKLPVVVDLPGNGGYHNAYGDVCTGRPENQSLGFGLARGGGAEHPALVVSVPFLQHNYSIATNWWGDAGSGFSAQATVELLRDAVAYMTAPPVGGAAGSGSGGGHGGYGGDAERVTLSGFSRGAIGAWFVGLWDDTVASLWSSFLVYAHCDGEYPTGLPGDAPANVTARLARLRGRSAYVCNCDVSAERAAVEPLCPQGDGGGACSGLLWRNTPFRNHNDQWLLRPSVQRSALWRWWQNVSS